MRNMFYLFPATLWFVAAFFWFLAGFPIVGYINIMLGFMYFGIALTPDE